MRKPLGLAIIGLLTLVSGLALGLLQMSMFVVSAVGMGPGLTSPLDYWPAGLAIFAFIVGARLLGKRSKGTRTLAMVYCVILTLVFLPVSYGFLQGVYQSCYSYSSVTQTYIWLGPSIIPMYEWEIAFVSLTPFVYAIGCLLYFRTKTMKHYFSA